jgi:hypothetical protein
LNKTLLLGTFTHIGVQISMVMRQKIKTVFDELRDNVFGYDIKIILHTGKRLWTELACSYYFYKSYSPWKEKCVSRDCE